MSDTPDSRSLLQRLHEDASSAVTDLIYTKINDLFGAGDQLFTMEFPSRPLSQMTYAYDADTVYSSITRPTAVQEAEFSLSDALYDMVPIIQSSNGENLSSVYETIINNFVPKMDFLKDFVTDKNALRAWLLEEVDDVEFSDDGSAMPSTIKISRMQLCEKLYMRFLDERNAWSKEKNERFSKSKGDDALIEEYAQWVTTEATVRDEQINNLFRDAVVRGSYHEVMTILGFLNVESPAERLEKTKQNMRASVKRSLDGSSDVYPVQFQPANWFKALKPNLHPKDLTMSSDVLLAEFNAKQKTLQELQEKMASLKEREVSQERIEELKQAVEEKKAALDTADAKVEETCGQGAANILHMAIKIYSKVTNPADAFSDAVAEIKEQRSGKKTEELEGATKSLASLLEGFSDEMITGMASSYNAVAEALRSSENAISALSDYTEAMSKNNETERALVSSQISSLQADIEYLRPLVSGVISLQTVPDNSAPLDHDSESNASLLPEAVQDDSDSTFMDVIITSEDITKQSQDSESSRSSSGSWKVGGWFASVGHTSSSSQAESNQENISDTAKIELGFRATKVSIDRGSWFDPTLFKLTENYYRLAESRVSGGFGKDDMQQALANSKPDNAVRTLSKFTNEDNVQQNYLLPSFPTSFIIAKDITLRLDIQDEEDHSSKEYAQSQSSTSGGLFGFSASSGTESKSTSESAYLGVRNQHLYIRIPGPQILGWFQQIVPADNAERYKALDGNPFDNEAKQNLMLSFQNNASTDTETIKESQNDS